MANTIIQIRRSSANAVPQAGTLSAAEPAYSYLSDKLFLGTSDGSGVIAVGGKYFVDQQNTILTIANLAFDAANSAMSGSMDYAYVNTATQAANSYANKVGAASNGWANTVGTAANGYAAAVGTAANSYAAGVGSAANTNAANASYINTGTLNVAFGGTGTTTFTTNGVLYGNGVGPLQVTGAGTDGQVLVSQGGVPQFRMLDGGTF